MNTTVLLVTYSRNATRDSCKNIKWRREREREGGRGRESDIHIKLAAHIRGGTAVGCTAVPS